MPDFRLRKMMLFSETIHHENGPPPATQRRRAAIVAVVARASKLALGVGHVSPCVFCPCLIAVTFGCDP